MARHTSQPRGQDLPTATAGWLPAVALAGRARWGEAVPTVSGGPARCVFGTRHALPRREYRAERDRTRLANEVALRVLGYRHEHALSQSAFARLIGMPQPNVARLEAADHEPSASMLSRLSAMWGEPSRSTWTRPARTCTPPNCGLDKPYAQPPVVIRDGRGGGARSLCTRRSPGVGGDPPLFAGQRAVLAR